MYLSHCIYIICQQNFLLYKMFRIFVSLNFSVPDPPGHVNLQTNSSVITSFKEKCMNSRNFVPPNTRKWWYWNKVKIYYYIILQFYTGNIQVTDKSLFQYWNKMQTKYSPTSCARYVLMSLSISSNSSTVLRGKPSSGS